MKIGVQSRELPRPREGVSHSIRMRRKRTTLLWATLFSTDTAGRVGRATVVVVSEVIVVLALRANGPAL